MSSYNPLISIIIPVYNAEKFLHSCIDSVIQQTYGNLEIILINDGSTDLSGNICDEYAQKDKRIYVINVMNKGVSKARNIGLDYAKGEYISFVDSDDIMCSNMIESLYTDLINNNCEASICGFLFIYPNKQICLYEKEGLLLHDSNEAICNMMIDKYYTGHIWNKLFKSSIIKKIRFDEQIYICEDKLFVTQAFLNCNKIAFRSNPLYNYYIRNESAFHKPLDERYYTSHIACLKIINLLNNNINTKVIDCAYASDLICNINMMNKLYYDKTNRKKYSRIIVENIRSHCNLSSIRLLNNNMKYQVIAAYINPHMFFLLRKLVNLISKTNENRN